MERLKDCWTVRAAFSPGESSLQRTVPVSFATVTCLLGGGGGGEELWVVGVGRDVEKAMRAVVRLRGITCGRQVAGRRS